MLVNRTVERLWHGHENTIAVVVMLVFAGCASESQQIAILDQSAVRPARDVSAPVEVLMEQPKRPYVVVAMASVTGDERNLRDDIESLRSKARTVGGDAVIVKSSEPMLDRGPMRTTYQVTREGTIIRWR